MSDNVIRPDFTKSKGKRLDRYTVHIDVGDDGIEAVNLVTFDGEDQTELLKKHAGLMLTALWWIGRDHRERAPDDPEGLDILITIATGSLVKVHSPKADNPDAYEGKARVAWLARRLSEAFQLAQPSLSEGEIVSGTILLPHSANIPQMQSSPSTISGPSTPQE